MKRDNNHILRSYEYAKTTVGSLLRNNLSLAYAKSDDVKKLHLLIERSGYFDSSYYLTSNPDVKKSGMDPLVHYILHGGAEGRNPSAQFDSTYYLSKNADVREMRANPLVHYLLVGEKEARSTRPVTHSPASKKKSHKNTSKSKQVDIINVNFYDWDGKVLYKGGAERYVFDLAQILLKMGHKPRILQNANKPFVKEYRGVSIVGVVTGAAHTDGLSLRKMSAAFSEVCQKADLIVASPLDLGCEITTVPVIGINHGIHWDSKLKRIHNNRTSDYSEIFDALANITVGICVDTNFINWTRTYDYQLGEKLKYIPNYYDKHEFTSTKKDFNGRLKVMYPRRLYDARGIYLTLDAFDYLLKKYQDVDLLLVGQTSDPHTKASVKKLIKKYSGRVTLEEYDMEDMHKAYEKSNVVLIPTRYAEGTSLSCLEAMATNNTLISTNIGGLPNLVVDQYNGLLIDPSVDALIEAVEAVINDRKLAKRLADRGLEMVQVFEKTNWDKRWEKILKEVL